MNFGIGDEQVRWIGGITGIVVAVLASLAMGFFPWPLIMTVGALVGKYRLGIALIYFGAVWTSAFLLPFAFSTITSPPREATLVVAGAWVVAALLILSDLALVLHTVKRYQR